MSGSVDDAVLGTTTISATGAEVAPGLSAVALAVAAASIALVAAGRLTRLVAVVGYAACLLLAAGLTTRVLVDPDGALGPVAASRVGRTGTLDTVADPTAWPWFALLAVLVCAVGLAGAVVGAAAVGRSLCSIRRPRDGGRPCLGGPGGAGEQRLGRAVGRPGPHRCGQ